MILCLYNRSSARTRNIVLRLVFAFHVEMWARLPSRRKSDYYFQSYTCKPGNLRQVRLVNARGIRVAVGDSEKCC